MNRSCVWLCTLTAATAAAAGNVRAATVHGPVAVHGLMHAAAGPEPRTPGPGSNAVIKPPAPPSSNYKFSGNSFNLSVTRNGKPFSTPSPPPVTPQGSENRPGLIRRMLDWALGD